MIYLRTKVQYYSSETSLGKSESMKVFTEIVIRAFEERRELSDFEITSMKRYIIKIQTFMEW